MRTDLSFHRGERYRQRFQWFHDDGVTPVPLDGVTFSYAVKKKPTGDDKLTSTAFTIVDSDQGLFELVLTSAQTAALAHGRHVYEVDVDEGNGLVKRLFSGRLEVRDAGDPVDCPGLVSFDCDPEGLEDVTVALLANDYGLTDSGSWLLGNEDAAFQIGEAPASAVVASFAELSVVDSAGVADTVEVFTVAGPDGTYTFRGL